MGQGLGDKVRTCHQTTPETKSFVEIEVSDTPVPDYLAHGDFHRNRCVDDDCANGQQCVDGSRQDTCVGAAKVCKTDDCCGALCCDINHICDNDCGCDCAPTDRPQG